MTRRELRESDIEKYLVAQVLALRGEVRKLRWIGRNSAPDRVVMLPGAVCIWVELKVPGGLAVFPKNAHEEAQHREHERMRAVGQRVEVIDSHAGVNRLLETRNA